MPVILLVPCKYLHVIFTNLFIVFEAKNNQHRKKEKQDELKKIDESFYVIYGIPATSW